MNIFKKIGNTVSNLFKNKKVQEVVQDGVKKVVGSTTPGAILAFAMDLGAFDWLAQLIGRSIEKVSGVSDTISQKVVLFATKAVVETQEQIDAGKLETAEQKRGFAQERFKFHMLNDSELKNYPNIINIAPVLIQFVYETGKLKLLADQKNREQIAKIMVEIGTKAITDKFVDPVKEFFAQLDLLEASQES